MRFLGKLFLLLIAAVVVLAVYCWQLNKDATTYVEDAIPKIVTNWNDQELINRATPELLTTIKTRANIDNLFLRFRQLGALKQIGTPKGSAGISAFSGKGIVRYANYEVPATFERGTAIVSIRVIRINDEWKINGFHVNSDLFLK